MQRKQQWHNLAWREREQVEDGGETNQKEQKLGLEDEMVLPKCREMD